MPPRKVRGQRVSSITINRVLEIDKIVQSICEHVNINSGSKRRSHSNLLRLALTCKAFNNPALDALWEINTNIRSIFYPFITQGALRVDNRELILVRHVTHADWTSFAPYARRIVEVNWSSSFRISDEACLTLLASSPRATIFPKIQTLTLFGTTKTEFLAASLFSSSSLVSLQAHADTPNSCITMPSFLSNIGFNSANLEQLRLTLPIDAEITTNMACEVALALQSIPKLEVFNLEAPSLFLHFLLYSLPRLKNLRKFWLLSNSPSEEEQTESRDVELPNLTDLSLVSRSTELDLSTFGQMTKNCPLKTVTIKFRDQFRPGDVASVLKGLHDCAQSSVEVVTIGALGSFVAEGPITVDHLQTLSHSSFASLRSLDIGGFFTFSLDDLRLVTLGRWCPRLESLHLRSYAPSSLKASPTVTLTGLITLARILKNLLNLTLPVKLDPALVKREPQAQTSKLLIWDPSYSTVKNPSVTSVTLLYFFPNLESVKPLHRSPDKVAEQWWSSSDTWERERIRSVEGFKEIHSFIEMAASNRKPGQSTRDAAKELFG